MKPLAECRLYSFIDTAYLQGRNPAELVKALCGGGADLIQLRAKNSTAEEVRRMAEQILPITERAGTGLVVNDYWELAQEIGAPVVHLGQEDFFETGYQHVTELPWAQGKARPQVGLSTHGPEQAGRAVEAGADYIAIGPVFPTGTKPTAKAVTLEYVRWAAANVKVPWFAIGGINLTNLDEVLKAGAERICVVSAILNENDVKGMTAKFSERIRNY